MKIKFDLTKLTLWVNRAIALLLAILVFTLPLLLDWYSKTRVLNDAERAAITTAFYFCAVIVAVALWQMDRLLQSILRKEVFIRENVRRIRINDSLLFHIALAESYSFIHHFFQRPADSFVVNKTGLVFTKLPDLASGDHDRRNPKLWKETLRVDSKIHHRCQCRNAFS